MATIIQRCREHAWHYAVEEEDEALQGQGDRECVPLSKASECQGLGRETPANTRIVCQRKHERCPARPALRNNQAANDSAGIKADASLRLLD